MGPSRDIRNTFVKVIRQARRFSSLRALIMLSLATFALVDPSIARAQQVINQLSQSADLVADIKQVCPAPRQNSHIAGYDLLKVDRLPEDFDSATVYKMSSNIIWTARTLDKNPALLFYAVKPNPSRACITLLVLRSGKGAVRFKQSVPDGDFRKHLPQIVSEEVHRLLAECEKNPQKTRRDYTGGQFDIGADGVVMEIEGFFNCDSAVLISLSAIDIAAGGRTIRAAYVHDTLFLFEKEE